jgi:succinyl-diaminopimelate desuccinylase
VSVLKQYEDRLGGTIQLQIVCDEEDNAYFGTPYLIELMEQGKLPRPDHVLVGEYTGLQVMTAERGSFKLNVSFRGRATHTATARVDGQNAIYAAAEAIRLLERDLDIEHPDVGRAVISVNQIRGGAFFSQVPDQCTIQIDRRMIPGETMESVMNGIQATVETLRDRIPWLAFEVSPCLDDRGQPRYAAPNMTSRDSPVAQAVRRAHELVTGKPAQDFRGWFGATDARCFRYIGIDCVNYGPSGEFAHGPNEYVLVDSLDAELAVMACAAAELAAMRDPST